MLNSAHLLNKISEYLKASVPNIFWGIFYNTLPALRISWFLFFVNVLAFPLIFFSLNNNNHNNHNTRMHETKMKELEMDIAKKTQSITDLKRLLQEATEREHNADKNLQDLKEQVSKYLSQMSLRIDWLILIFFWCPYWQFIFL